MFEGVKGEIMGVELEVEVKRYRSQLRLLYDSEVL